VIEWSDFSPELRGISSDTFTSYCRQCWGLEKEGERMLDASRKKGRDRAWLQYVSQEEKGEQILATRKEERDHQDREARLQHVRYEEEQVSI
jgi:hypothetical protein